MGREKGFVGNICHDVLDSFYLPIAVPTGYGSATILCHDAGDNDSFNGAATQVYQNIMGKYGLS